MSRGLSLANKCQLLFGAAVVLIIATALVLPWFRLTRTIDQAQFEASRQIARMWARSPWVSRNIGWYLEPTDAGTEPAAPAPDAQINAESTADAAETAGPAATETAGNGAAVAPVPGAAATGAAGAGKPQLLIGYWPMPAWREATFDSEFLQAAQQALSRQLQAQAGEHAGVLEYSQALWAPGRGRVYRLALLHGDAQRWQGVVVVERQSLTAAGQLFVNRMYLLIAALLAGVMAVLVFWYITKRIILGPVRSLRDTAELVRSGNLHIRSDIRTRDEFEQLAETFNAMLASLVDQQRQLRQINQSLDLKLNEVSERNIQLYEAARLKGEFVASVSHELRTPLNSIIGFAEILQELVERDADNAAADGSTALGKRKRYLDNIVSAGRVLLEMINELLTMAKIDAGRIELHVQPMNLGETCEALLAMIRPLAEKKQIELRLELEGAGRRMVSEASLATLPPLVTDPQKFQQVIFNFLSNAVKFTPERGVVTLRAEQLRGDPEQPASVRISVSDTGPGIPAAEQEAVFQRFRQIEGGHTRPQQGTGLGLAIAKEFAHMLEGEIVLMSEPGAGAMFALIVPLAMQAPPGLVAGPLDALRAEAGDASLQR